MKWERERTGKLLEPGFKVTFYYLPLEYLHHLSLNNFFCPRSNYMIRLEMRLCGAFITLLCLFNTVKILVIAILQF